MDRVIGFVSAVALVVMLVLDIADRVADRQAPPPEVRIIRT